MKPALSALEVTAPEVNKIRYDMAVQVRLRVEPTYQTKPWIRITADSTTEYVGLAAGVKITRRDDEDDCA
jgi:hypothetical protein